jgi:hypothetical protein
MLDLSSLTPFAVCPVVPHVDGAMVRPGGGPRYDAALCSLGLWLPKTIHHRVAPSVVSVRRTLWEEGPCCEEDRRNCCDKESTKGLCPEGLVIPHQVSQYGLVPNVGCRRSFPPGGVRLEHRRVVSNFKERRGARTSGSD